MLTVPNCFTSLTAISVVTAFINCDSPILACSLRGYKLLLQFTREMEFTARNGRRLVIVQLCGRYVQLAALSGQRL